MSTLNLVSPVDGLPLLEGNDVLWGKDGTHYPIVDGIADILDSRLADSALYDEIDVFEKLPVENVCYFRSAVLHQAVAAAGGCLPADVNAVTSVEIGGGEGYFASAFKKFYPAGISYVCDVSNKHLRNAADDLVKVRCDVRYPYIKEESIDIAAFWVSLHHFSDSDMLRAVEVASRMLKPNGVMVIFEPNSAFFPRKILLNSFLRRLVYFDEEEKSLCFFSIKQVFEKQNLSLIFGTAHNPPYNMDFLKKLRFGPLFSIVTEPFFQLERIVCGGGQRWQGKYGIDKTMLTFGSYIFAIFRKSTD